VKESPGGLVGVVHNQERCWLDVQDFVIPPAATILADITCVVQENQQFSGRVFVVALLVALLGIIGAMAAPVRWVSWVGVTVSITGYSVAMWTAVQSRRQPQR
jgi:hypothetical protein